MPRRSNSIPSLRPPTFRLEQADEWQMHLDEQGYVVLENVLAPERRHALIEQFWADWNSVSEGFRRDNGASWTRETAPLAYFDKGMAVYSGFGQADFLWDLRCEPAIHEIFRRVHDNDELCTSLDGFSVFFSDEQQPQLWLHIDQNPRNPLYCVQGAYNFYSVDEHDAGFVVIPKSHMRVFETEAMGDWVVLRDPKLQDEAVKLLIPENAFVLWNSRTVHANTGMNMSKKPHGKEQVRSLRSNPPMLNRLTCYITMMPKYLRTQKALEEKERAYRESATTSHWANRCEVKKFPEVLRESLRQKGIGTVVPQLCEDGSIPADRQSLL